MPNQTAKATEETEQTTQLPATFDPKAPIKLGVTSVALAKLKKEFAKVPDASTKEGYQEIVEAKRKLTPLRTGVIKEADIQKAAAQLHLNKINKVKNHIVETIQAIEKPLYAEKKRADDEVARKKLEEEQKEERRVADIESKIEDIQSLTEGLLGADLATLTERLTEARSVHITTEVFMEFVEPASMVLGQVTQTLERAVDSGRQLAEQQEQLKQQQEAFAQQQAELKKQQDEIDRQKREHEAKVEVDRLAQEEKERIEREAKEKQEHEEREAAEAAEREAELKARLPEDVKLRAYVDALLDVERPEIADPVLNGIINMVYERLLKISDYVVANTQDPE